MPTDPHSLPQHLREMERRIEVLERAPRLGNSSINDDNDVERIVLGQLDEDDPDSFGIRIANADTVAVLEVDAAGVLRPYQNWQASRWDESVPVTSAAYVPTWAESNPYSTADAMRLTVYLATDPATTGEARLSSNLGGSPVTSAVTIPAGTATYYEWNWAMPGLVAGTGPIVITLDVRRTSGAGNVYAYQPIQCFSGVASDLGATPTGV
jgi:hypothetical protein